MGQSYDAVAKFLHWTIALAIIGMIALGYTMESMAHGNPMRFQLFQLHKSIGITILLLSLFRLYWRLRHPPPPLPADMPQWEKVTAKTLVVIFYVLMIGIPFLGWGIVSASPLNLPTLLYGFIPWPHLPILPTLDNKKEISDVLAALHTWLAYSVLGLLVLHIGGAWKHHLFSRDDVLTRMAPNFLTPLLNRLRRS